MCGQANDVFFLLFTSICGAWQIHSKEKGVKLFPEMFSSLLTSSWWILMTSRNPDLLCGGTCSLGGQHWWWLQREVILKWWNCWSKEVLMWTWRTRYEGNTTLTSCLHGSGPLNISLDNSRMVSAGSAGMSGNMSFAEDLNQGGKQCANVLSSSSAHYRASFPETCQGYAFQHSWWTILIPKTTTPPNQWSPIHPFAIHKWHKSEVQPGWP